MEISIIPEREVYPSEYFLKVEDKLSLVFAKLGIKGDISNIEIFKTNLTEYVSLVFRFFPKTGNNYRKIQERLDRFFSDFDIKKMYGVTSNFHNVTVKDVDYSFLIRGIVSKIGLWINVQNFIAITSVNDWIPSEIIYIEPVLAKKLQIRINRIVGENSKNPMLIEVEFDLKIPNYAGADRIYKCKSPLGSMFGTVGGKYKEKFKQLMAILATVIVSGKMVGDQEVDDIDLNDAFPNDQIKMVDEEETLFKMLLEDAGMTIGRIYPILLKNGDDVAEDFKNKRLDKEYVLVAVTPKQAEEAKENIKKIQNEAKKLNYEKSPDGERVVPKIDTNEFKEANEEYKKYLKEINEYKEDLEWANAIIDASSEKTFDPAIFQDVWDILDESPPKLSKKTINYFVGNQYIEDSLKKINDLIFSLKTSEEKTEGILGKVRLIDNISDEELVSLGIQDIRGLSLRESVPKYQIISLYNDDSVGNVKLDKAVTNFTKPLFMESVFNFIKRKVGYYMKQRIKIPKGKSLVLTSINNEYRTNPIALPYEFFDQATIEIFDIENYRNDVFRSEVSLYLRFMYSLTPKMHIINSQTSKELLSMSEPIMATASCKSPLVYMFYLLGGKGELSKTKENLAATGKAFLRLSNLYDMDKIDTFISGHNTIKKDNVVDINNFLMQYKIAKKRHFNESVSDKSIADSIKAEFGAKSVKYVKNNNVFEFEVILQKRNIDMLPVFGKANGYILCSFSLEKEIEQVNFHYISAKLSNEGAGFDFKKEQDSIKCKIPANFNYGGKYSIAFESRSNHILSHFREYGPSVIISIKEIRECIKPLEKKALFCNGKINNSVKVKIGNVNENLKEGYVHCQNGNFLSIDKKGNVYQEIIYGSRQEDISSYLPKIMRNIV